MILSLKGSSTKESADMSTAELSTYEQMAEELADLREFKQQWEPVLIQMVPALVSIVNLATGMMPPAMQGMIPPQVRAFVEATR